VRRSEGDRGRSLGEALAAPADDGYLAFRDVVGGLEYLRAGRELHDQGLYFELGAYDLHVFLDFREVRGDRYRMLAKRLSGRGAPSLDDALAELELAPVLDPFRRLMSGDSLRRLASVRATGGRGESPEAVLADIAPDLRTLVEAVRDRVGGQGDTAAVVAAISSDLETVLRSPARSVRGRHLDRWLGEDLGRWATLQAWVVTRGLKSVTDDRSGDRQVGRWIDDWLLDRSLTGALRELGVDDDTARRMAAAVRVVAVCQGWYENGATGSDGARQVVHRVVDDPEGHRLLGIHTHDDVVWFRAEGFEEFVGWLLTATIVDSAGDPRTFGRADRIAQLLSEAAEASGYRVAELLSAFDAEANC
jgi:hypothetical protein